MITMSHSSKKTNNFFCNWNFNPMAELAVDEAYPFQDVEIMSTIIISVGIQVNIYNDKSQHFVVGILVHLHAITKFNPTVIVCVYPTANENISWDEGVQYTFQWDYVITTKQYQTNKLNHKKFQ